MTEPTKTNIVWYHPSPLEAMTDADRAAVVRKFNARMEMTRRDVRLIWAKDGS